MEVVRFDSDFSASGTQTTFRTEITEKFRCFIAVKCLPYMTGLGGNGEFFPGRLQDLLLLRGVKTAPVLRYWTL